MFILGIVGQEKDGWETWFSSASSPADPTFKTLRLENKWGRNPAGSGQCVTSLLLETAGHHWNLFLTRIQWWFWTPSWTWALIPRRVNGFSTNAPYLSGTQKVQLDVHQCYRSSKGITAFHERHMIYTVAVFNKFETRWSFWIIIWWNRYSNQQEMQLSWCFSLELGYLSWW